MCTYFNALALGTTMPKEGLLAHITVLPKNGKDHTVSSSYRPISLLNTDIKILAKILANRLQPIMPSIIHPDQMGFITGREVRDNSKWAIQLIHWAQTLTNHPPCPLLSTDAEKAFDRVNWTYLRAVLTKMRLGPKMLSWVLSLYSNPKARVKVNGVLSDTFPIENGTRQRCHYPLLSSPSPWSHCSTRFAPILTLRALVLGHRNTNYLCLVLCG